MHATNKLLLVGVCFLIVGVALAQDYLDDEEPKPSLPSRPTYLRRPGIIPRGKSTSTTPATPPPTPKEAAPVEEDIPEDEFAAEDEAEEDLTTTPASRKIKSGVVRPFRSNDDLLAALKRRRAEAASGKSHHVETPSAPVAEQPVEPYSNNKNTQARRRYNQPSKVEQNSTPEETTQSPKRNLQRNRFNTRGSFKSNSADNGEIAGLETNQQSIEVKPRVGYKPGQKRF